MPKTQTNTRMRDYARAGAEQRLAVLDQERNDILALFPDLGRRRPGRKPKADGAAAPTPTVGRKRRGMSAAQRKAVGERMKKYWAARRAETQTAGGATEPSQTARAGQRRSAPRKK
jgi:hypothetical protein